MIILGIDPGSRYTGWAVYDAFEKRVIDSGVVDRETDDNLLGKLRWAAETNKVERVFIEMPMARGGKCVGEALILTAFLSGNIYQMLVYDYNTRLIRRYEAVKELSDWCRGRGEKLPVKRGDSFVRSVLLDYIGPQGKKKSPGPTYGVKSHAWAALACAVAGARIVQKEAEKK